MARFKVLATCAVLAVLGCTNNPYPDADRDQKVLYSSFSEAPKTLDPAVAYTTAEHIITGNVYDTLLEYHYLKRPYELIPGLAEARARGRSTLSGRRLRPTGSRSGAASLFHADPCFALSQGDRRSSEVVAADFAFQLARIADPAVNSPVVSSFAQVAGLLPSSPSGWWSGGKADAAFAALPVHEQYRSGRRHRRRGRAQ